MIRDTLDARRSTERRAFSLLELAAVVVILGLVAGMAITRWGDLALAVASSEGYARQIDLALRLARRQAIAEGTPAALVLSRSGSDVSSISLYRATSGGDVLVDGPWPVPDGATVTTSPNGMDRWEFDYTGTLTTPAAGGELTVTADWNWVIDVNPVTGHVGLTRQP